MIYDFNLVMYFGGMNHNFYYVSRYIIYIGTKYNCHHLPRVLVKYRLCHVIHNHNSQVDNA